MALTKRDRSHSKRKDKMNTENSVAIIGRNGRNLGKRVNFCGQQSASSLRDCGKRSGLKGKELTGYVNAQLTGESAKAAGIMASGFLSAAIQSGYVPTAADLKANTFCIRGQKPSVAKEPKQAKPVITLDNPEVAALVAKAVADTMAKLK